MPNMVWANSKKPKDYEQAKKRENKLLLAFERIGEAFVTASLLVFLSINPRIVMLPDGVYFRWNLLLKFKKIDTSILM